MSMPKMQQRPNIILSSLQNSGSSALDPIFRDILADIGYYVKPIAPEEKPQLAEVLGRYAPYYHWTHDPIGPFRHFNLLGRQECRFIYLHRDLRDVAVSMAKDQIVLGKCQEGDEREILFKLLRHVMPSIANNAVEWVEYAKIRPDICIVIRFNDIKANIRMCLRRIFSFLQLSISEDALNAAIKKHSFEAITGRKRGEAGPAFRTRYLLRKGISGEWKKYFDTDLRNQTKNLIGHQLLDLGWCDDWTWGIKEINLVSPPFPCCAAWLADILVVLNIKTTTIVPSFKDQHWRFKHQQLTVAGSTCEHFSFEPDIEVIWEHRLDFAMHPERSTILYVRDPRAAIYSQYCCHYQDTLSLDDFLNRPEVWPHGIAGLFSLPPAQTWAMHIIFWCLLVSFVRLKIVRFEEMRRDPGNTVKDILLFLRCSDRTNGQIGKALNASDFDADNETVEQSSVSSKPLVDVTCGGNVGEWQAMYSQQQLSFFEDDELVQYAMRISGYEAPAINPVIIPDENDDYDKMYSNHVSDKAQTAAGKDGERFASALSQLYYCVPEEKHAAFAASCLATDWCAKIYCKKSATVSEAQIVFTYKIFKYTLLRFKKNPHVQSLVVNTLSVIEKTAFSHIEGILSLGNKQLSRKDFANAEATLEEVKRLAPNLTVARHALGTVYQ
ncbi:MAG: hypothetical protein GXP08_04405, partial [Gammaproteobacteria bacterium]|nr:hypothetical protein [Gammaproteobacteria bacterium]